MRLYATSDLHVDFEENRRFVEQLSPAEFTEDALIIAGDVAHRLDLIGETLDLLKRKFGEVFYVPGNHELWVGKNGEDSVKKFFRILELCDQLGVRTGPAEMEGCRIVPLFSWYDDSFDGRVDDPSLQNWVDFRHCRWPSTVEAPALFFAGLNGDRIRASSEPTVSFSHFLPRPELLPDRHFLRFKGLPQVAGSASIERMVRQLGARVHVFGHSHIRRDVVLEGVRYVQHHLGYPRERRDRSFELKQIDWNLSADTEPLQSE
ncbi:MAG: metallophosphoesterase [Gemmatimonadetes bacterium]|jgi:predicted phosphodiesterase|nr:metallophosphoesterase [Gemmatimonadota bacterium]